MHKLYLLIITCFASLLSSNAQKEKTDARDILSQINIDSTTLLRNVAKSACNCVDSVNTATVENKKKREAIAACIDKEVSAYELALQLLNTLKASGGEKTIYISDKKSDQYKHYYYEIERRLKDSCEVLNKALNTNDETSEKSFSENPKAKEAYNKGVKMLEQNKYADAIPWFEKAVETDPEFVFAWDNLGVCYRRTGKYEKAEAAYKASLKIEPSGKTPLQNLPIVYKMQNKNNEAIAAYKDLLKYYPDDPEVYYGISLIYYDNLKDMEKALDNMCKAYNIYVEQKSAFRSDAEKVINMIYSQMKKDNKEDLFYKILKENNISSN